MNAIFLLESKRSIKHWLSYFVVLILISIGIFCGNKFNLSVGEGIYLNSPYTIGYMTGMLSLSIIFFAIFFASQQLFKDWDSKFDSILFSFPLSKSNYLKGKFFTFFLQTYLSFSFLMLGFLIGQNSRTGSEIQDYFNIGYYLYPLLIFGCINCLLVCSFLFFISLLTKRKLLVVIGGLLLYVLYMVILIFSNSPFMAGSTPQSLEAQQLSSLIDPFGISSYFFEAKNFNVHQKNKLLVPFSGYLFMNRLLFILISGIFCFLTFKWFSFSRFSNKKATDKVEKKSINSNVTIKNYTTASLDFKSITALKSIISFAKIDLIYLFKSIVIVAVSILLLFSVGMEMYAEIEKGIRLPQKYASSGLMATTISENFHFIGLLIVTYFINDLYWRSHSSGFSLIEKSTYFSKNKLSGHLIAVSILLFFFTGILMIEGLIFQLSYHYFHIDWNAYLGTFIFNTFPLILFSVFILLINDNFKNRFIALGISVLALFLFSGPISKMIITNPLLRIFSDFKGVYSDFNGYGIYTTAFIERLLFGIGLISSFWIMNEYFKSKKICLRKTIISCILLITGIFSGNHFMKNYIPENKDEVVFNAGKYEKQFRKYENLPQPIITDVITKIDLFPSQNSYEISGKYTLMNQSHQPIDKILINFNPDLKIQSAIFKTSSETKKINNTVTELHLHHPLQPGEKAQFDLF